MPISPLGSGVSSPTVTLEQQNTGRQDFAQLGSSLESGDLAGAEKAYAALQQLQIGQQQQTGASSPGIPRPGSPTQNAFVALGQALASGNLTQAQTLFSQLKSDLTGGQGLQGARGRGHHRHHGAEPPPPVASSTSVTTDPTASADSSGFIPGSVNLVA